MWMIRLNALDQTRGSLEDETRPGRGGLRRNSSCLPCLLIAVHQSTQRRPSLASHVLGDAAQQFLVPAFGLRLCEFENVLGRFGHTDQEQPRQSVGQCKLGLLSVSEAPKLLSEPVDAGADPLLGLGEHRPAVGHPLFESGPNEGAGGCMTALAGRLLHPPAQALAQPDCNVLHAPHLLGRGQPAFVPPQNRALQSHYVNAFCSAVEMVDVERLTPTPVTPRNTIPLCSTTPLCCLGDGYPSLSFVASRCKPLPFVAERCRPEDICCHGGEFRCQSWHAPPPPRPTL